MNHQEWAGRSRYTWQGSEFSLHMVPGVLQVLSITMALKKLAFELARALGRQYFIEFSVKGARNKMHALTSIAIFFSILGPIWINPFSVTPYKYVKCPIFVWAAHLKALCGYQRFNKWSDFFGSPGIKSEKQRHAAEEKYHHLTLIRQSNPRLAKS